MSLPRLVGRAFPLIEVEVVIATSPSSSGPPHRAAEVRRRPLLREVLQTTSRQIAHRATLALPRRQLAVPPAYSNEASGPDTSGVGGPDHDPTESRGHVFKASTTQPDAQAAYVDAAVGRPAPHAAHPGVCLPLGTVNRRPVNEQPEVHCLGSHRRRHPCRLELRRQTPGTNGPGRPRTHRDKGRIADVSAGEQHVLVGEGRARAGVGGPVGRGKDGHFRGDRRTNQALIGLHVVPDADGYTDNGRTPMRHAFAGMAPHRGQNLHCDGSVRFVNQSISTITRPPAEPPPRPAKLGDRNDGRSSARLVSPTRRTSPDPERGFPPGPPGGSAGQFLLATPGLRGVLQALRRWVRDYTRNSRTKQPRPEAAAPGLTMTRKDHPLGKGGWVVDIEGETVTEELVAYSGQRRRATSRNWDMSRSHGHRRSDRQDTRAGGGTRCSAEPQQHQGPRRLEETGGARAPLLVNVDRQGTK